MKKYTQLFLGTVISCSILNAQKLETNDFILQIEKSVTTENLPVLKNVSPKDNTWKSGNPTFEIKDTKSELVAKGWLAFSTDNLLMKIEVTDDKHLNDKELGDIWNGDAIQIGIDTEGNGAGEMPKETPGMVGNDAGIGLGIGKNGPEAFAWFLGGTFVSIPLDKKFIKIERIETKKLTVYELSIPFSMLKLIAGTYAKIGFAIQINDTDPDKKEQNRISWGAGAGGNATPGLYQQMLIDNPKNTFNTSYKLNQMIWSKGEYAEICFTASSTETLTLTAISNGLKTQVTVSGNNSFPMERYSVKLYPKDLSKSLTLEAYLSNSKNEILSRQTSVLAIPEVTIIDFTKRVDSLISIKNNHSLFDRHLNSVKALVLSEWGKMNVYKTNKRAQQETYRFIYDINEGLKSDAGKWENYLNNDRTLTMAFVSKRDGTLQYYSLDLPKNWDINKAYPLFFELHGAGNPHALSSLKSQLGSSTSSLDLFGYTSSKSYMQQQGIGYHVAPYGRGNSRYKDIGEIDIFEAFQDVHKNFKIDENRRYLYGFSMGGGGTWSVGIRTPDLWAAIGIYAGGLWNEKPAVSLGKNLENTPTYIWCGDKDGLFSNLPLMQKELERYNIKPEVRITKGLDHKYPDSVQAVGLNWMIQFARKRPDKFTFSADKDEHTGVWGISMTREESVSGLPTFDCTIEGQTIKIDSKGTAGLKVNLGDNGLKMKGLVTVIWNGKKEYEGEAKEITLGKQIKDSW